MHLVEFSASSRPADSELRRIDVAVFSDDVWQDGHSRSFLGAALRMPDLRWMHVFAAGLDDPVFDQFAARGVRLTGAPGSTAVPIAHTVIGMVIAMCRNTSRYGLAQTRHEWAPLEALDLEGRRMCVVGLGAIGTAVASIALHLGMHVVGVRRTPTGNEPCPTARPDRLHDLLPSADDLVLTASLTDASRGMIGRVELALLPRGAHLVNVGRGALVDESAMIAALQSGQLGAAALDVVAAEPLAADSPLWDLPNVIITPHAAGRTALGSERAAAMFTDNLGRWMHGLPLLHERSA